MCSFDFRPRKAQEMEKNEAVKRMEEKMRPFAMSWKIVVNYPANGQPLDFWGTWYVIENLSCKLLIHGQLAE